MSSSSLLLWSDPLIKTCLGPRGGKEWSFTALLRKSHMLKKEDKEKRTAGLIFQRDDLSHNDLVTRMQELDKWSEDQTHSNCVSKCVQTNIGRIKTPESFWWNSLAKKKQNTIANATAKQRIVVFLFFCGCNVLLEHRLPVWASRRTDWGANNERRAPALHSCRPKTLGLGKLTPRSRSVRGEKKKKTMLLSLVFILN